MTTTTRRHLFDGGGFDGHHVALIAIALLAGAIIGFATSTVVWFGTTHNASVTAAAHAPMGGTSAVQLEQELDDATRTLQYNQALLPRIESDPRWEQPAQRAGLTYALETTLAEIADAEARVAALQMQLEDGVR